MRLLPSGTTALLAELDDLEELSQEVERKL